MGLPRVAKRNTEVDGIPVLAGKYLRMFPTAVLTRVETLHLRI